MGDLVGKEANASSSFTLSRSGNGRFSRFPVGGGELGRSASRGAVRGGRNDALRCRPKRKYDRYRENEEKGTDCAVYRSS